MNMFKKLIGIITVVMLLNNSNLCAETCTPGCAYAAGCGYRECRAAPSLAPGIVFAVVLVAAVVAVAVQNANNHHCHNCHTQ
jgi:hypothetical protein